MPALSSLLLPFAITAAGSFTLAMLLTLLPKSTAGRRLADTFARAPLLDVLVALFTWAPWVATWIVLGPSTIPAAVAGQIVALTLWIFIHERLYPSARRGPRIVTFLNRTVGRLRNHTALWLTVPALPVFLSIRLAQLTFYPMLTVVVRLPRYRQGEWINVSRHKFEGLVGHDLIWCLYCDWMTGVYSLGAEMLRNVESFWCPIRFYDGKKCENCRTDFPDIDGGWTDARGNMTDVEKTMQAMHGQGNHAWFGHPSRTPASLTVNGEKPKR